MNDLHVLKILGLKRRLLENLKYNDQNTVVASIYNKSTCLNHMIVPHSYQIYLTIKLNLPTQGVVELERKLNVF